ncbi:MAG TPA: hypothetical protein PKW69_00370 [Niabella sp.]|nr:hypothetical protein [Niabella sp.]
MLIYGKTIQALIIFSFLTLSSCSINQFIFKEERFQNLGQLKVYQVSKYDLNNGFKDVSPEHLISIGQSIYPNSNNYTLVVPKRFLKRVKNFRLTTEYYFTSTDSLIRVILYQWDKVGSKDQKKAFQNQFNQLAKRLTKKLGKPSNIEIQQKEFNDKTFRDGIKWLDQTNTKAYLFMFGNDRTQYRQIRLAVYND